MPEIPTVHIALPAMNEADFIRQTIHCIQNQNYPAIQTWVCVNQPDDFHNRSEKLSICESNSATLQMLSELQMNNLHVIDRSSPGLGWQKNDHGVGMARKTIMDAIACVAYDSDVIVSMDADTTFGEKYITSVVQRFQKYPDALALANPYFHPLTDDPELNRALLRYEIYMRYYALNLLFIGTPFHFSPLGSAMASTVKAYRLIGGMTPKKSGEDFYFLQKMAKSGRVLTWNSETVFPATRLSDRVFFGTGPALIKGLAEGWDSYPLFNPELFAHIRDTIGLFPSLFEKKVPIPMDHFLKIQFGEDDVFEPLRQNHKNRERFVKACHQKIDGLRILQYLKFNHALSPVRDEDNLRILFSEQLGCSQLPEQLTSLDFSHSPLKNIDFIRNLLFETELKIRKEHG